MTALGLIANPRSGRMAREGEDLLASLKAHDAVKAVELIGEQDIGSAIARLREAKVDAIAIAGGDGTIRGVADAMAEAAADGKADALPLLPLPLGTANLLPRSLYGDRGARDLLDQAGEFRRAPLMAGTLNGRIFLVAAAIGFPSTFARAREALRDDNRPDRMVSAWTRLATSLRQAFSPRLRYRLDDARHPVRARASGIYVPVPRKGGEFEGVLVHWRHPADLLRTPVDLFTGAGNGDDGHDAGGATRLAQFRHLSVDSRKPLSAMIDGEPFMLDSPASLTACDTPPEALIPPS